MLIIESAGIIKQQPNGTFKAIKVLNDGSPLGVGMNLLANYDNDAKVDKLLELGTISSLGFTLNPSPVVKKYGFDFRSNPKFKQLPKKNQDKAIKSLSNPVTTNSIYKYRPDKMEKPITLKRNQLTKFIDFIRNERLFYYIYLNHEWHMIEQFTDRTLNLTTIQDFINNYYEITTTE